MTNAQTIKHSRIETLHKLAKTGKYDWDALRQRGLEMGASKTTVESYLDEVYARLKKEGLIQ